MRAADFSSLLRVLEVFDALQIPYLVGGSAASSIHGLARPTQDFDVVAGIRPDQVPELVARLKDEYYADQAGILEAIRTGSSFNLISFETMDKVDVFPAGDSDRDRRELERAVFCSLGPDTPEVRVASPEDSVLRKLEWFRAGGGVSDRQWSDVLGVLKVQGGRFNLEYARREAAKLGVGDLLQRAAEEAGLA